MPTIQDMGIAHALTRTPSILDDPSILLSALALRERKRTNRVDEGYRERVLTENTRQYDQNFGQRDREFDRAAGQRDRALDQDQQSLGLRRREFNQRQKALDTGMEDRARQLHQEAATQGYYADLAESEGMFPAPEVRAKFEAMPPDEQNRTLALWRAHQSEQRQAEQMGRLGTLLENASANKLMDPAASQAIFGQAEAGDIDGAYKQAQQLITQTAQKNADMQQRQMQAETLSQILPTLNIPAGRQAAYSSMLLTDPDASYTSILKMALEEQEQAEADRAAGEQLRMQVQQNAQDLLTLHPGATPETAGAAARLRGAGVPVGVGDANFSGETRQQIGEGDKASMEAARKRYEALGEDAPIGKRRKALRDYAEQFEAATGKPLPGADDLAPDDDEMDRALKQAKRKLGKGASEDEILAEAERIIYGAK